MGPGKVLLAHAAHLPPPDEVFTEILKLFSGHSATLH